MIDTALLARLGPCKKFEAGQHIPCPGGSVDTEREMYILLEGKVDVLEASATGGMQTVGSLLPGDVFGGREFFTDIGGYIYTADADSKVYILTKNTFDELSWTRPEILFEVFRAAYMPSKKKATSKKAAINKDGNDSETKPKTVVKLAAASKKEHAADTKDGQSKAVKVPEDDNSALSFMLAERGIFPEGHKHYPGVTKPEFAQLIFPKDYDCPFCKKPFSDYKVFRSKLYEASPMRFDLRRFYTDFQTEWYDVITCHNCLFSTFHNYFTEPKPVQKVKIGDQLTAIRASILLDFDAERNIDFVFTTHYLALICSEGYLSLGKQMRAKLWGNLSWLYEDVGDGEMVKYAAQKAAEAYEAVYAETHLTPIQEQITCLSIAGMQYRAGLDRNLKKYLFTAKTVKMGDKTYAKLAEDFMFELRPEDEQIV